MLDQFKKLCGRCNGELELQEFHGIMVDKCKKCGNVMMDGSDLENLVTDKASQAPNLPHVMPPSIVPSSAPPPKRPNSATKGIMNLVSQTIMPPEQSSTTPAPPTRRSKSLLSGQKTGPAKTPPPPPPPKEIVEDEPTEPTLGFNLAGMEVGRNEPSLGLPGMDDLEFAPPIGHDEDTEEIERSFFTDEPTDFQTEETEGWTQEDELELEKFSSGQKWRGAALLLIGMAIIGLIVLIPGVLIALPYFQGEPVEDPAPDETIAQTPTPSIDEATPKKEDTPAPKPEETADAKPTTPKAASIPVPVETAPKEVPSKPVAKPKPQPKPKAQPVSSRKRWINEGWNSVERNPGAAAKSFRKALDLNQGDFEANYGYGYAMLKQGDPVEAKHYLCMASGSSDRETQREVIAVLNRHGMTCN